MSALRIAFRMKRTIVVFRSLSDGRRYDWDDFKQRGGPLVELIESLDMEVEIRMGDAMAPRGVQPSPPANDFTTKRRRGG